MGDRGCLGGGRQRKPSEFSRRSSVPEMINDALLMQCILESEKAGGFSDSFFYSAQQSWYEAAGYFVTFEKRFKPPACMVQYYIEVTQGVVKPASGQKEVAIGPSRKFRLFQT